MYRLSECEVCQFYAELLLRPVDRFNYEEFMECWRQSVPEGIKTDINYLRVIPIQCWGRYFLKVIYYLLLVTFPESTRYSYILPQ